MNPNQPIDPQTLAMMLMQRPGGGAATAMPGAGAGNAAGGDPMMQAGGVGQSPVEMPMPPGRTINGMSPVGMPQSPMRGINGLMPMPMPGTRPY
jgi:hypothetical protein